MSSKDLVAVESAVTVEQPAGLDVQIAAELLERARTEGVSLVGPGGLLQQITRAVLQTALEAEMADHLGYERGQSRPLDAVYPVVLIDCIFVKIRDGQVGNRPVYVAVGINLAGERDVLGMWVGTGGEGAKHWMGYLSELRNRGVADVMIVACDGLKGLPESIEQIWPQAEVQLCVVHRSRQEISRCVLELR